MDGQGYALSSPVPHLTQFPKGDVIPMLAALGGFAKSRHCFS